MAVAHAFRLFLVLGHRVSLGLMMALSVGVSVHCLGAAVGLWNWPELGLVLDGAAVPAAGMWGEIGRAVLLVGLMFFLPANARMLALEQSHRKFDMNMRDVTRAYHIAHAADRATAFRLVSEFDALKERLAFLRRHPDLDSLEPELLEIAARMSFASRDLARVYSEEKVSRARLYLRQRNEEIETFSERLNDARAVVEDLKAQAMELDLAEEQSQRDIQRLRTDLERLLPELFSENDTPPPGIVTPLRARRGLAEHSAE